MRKYLDCREVPGDVKCSLKISGEEDDLLVAAEEHAIKTHGFAAGPQLKDQLRGLLKPE